MSLDELIKSIFQDFDNNGSEDAVANLVLEWNRINYETLHDNVRQSKQERDAFKKTAKFWREEYLDLANSLDQLRKK